MCTAGSPSSNRTAVNLMMKCLEFASHLGGSCVAAADSKPRQEVQPQNTVAHKLSWELISVSFSNCGAFTLHFGITETHFINSKALWKESWGGISGQVGYMNLSSSFSPKCLWWHYVALIVASYWHWNSSVLMWPLVLIALLPKWCFYVSVSMKTSKSMASLLIIDRIDLISV